MKPFFIILASGLLALLSGNAFAQDVRGDLFTQTTAENSVAVGLQGGQALLGAFVFQGEGLYEGTAHSETTARNVAVVAISDSLALAGGIFQADSRVRADITEKTGLENVAVVAVGEGSHAQAGGTAITDGTAYEGGSITTEDQVKNSAAVAIEGGTALLGGVYLTAANLNDAKLQESTTATNVAVVAVGRDAWAQVGGIAIVGGRFSGSATAITDVRNTVAVAILGGSAQVGGIHIGRR